MIWLGGDCERNAGGEEERVVRNNIILTNAGRHLGPVKGIIFQPTPGLCF